MGGSNKDQTTRPDGGTQGDDQDNDDGHLPAKKESQCTINQTKLRDKISFFDQSKKNGEEGRTNERPQGQ